MLSQFWRKIISNLEFYTQTNSQSKVTQNNLHPTHHFKKILEDVLHQNQRVSQEKGSKQDTISENE